MVSLMVLDTPEGQYIETINNDQQKYNLQYFKNKLIKIQIEQINERLQYDELMLENEKLTKLNNYLLEKLRLSYHVIPEKTN